MNKNKVKKVVLILIIIILVILSLRVFFKRNTSTTAIDYYDEIIRSMSYDEFGDTDSNVENTENVKFSSFFLRDLDGDGYAEKLKGTCKEICSSDVLYLELQVQTGGYLKNGKI